MFSLVRCVTDQVGQARSSLDDHRDDQFKLEWQHQPGLCRSVSVSPQYGKGKLAVSSRTRWRTLARVSRFLKSSSVSEIISAIAAIWGSFMPRVVTAGVPSRMPLA